MKRDAFLLFAGSLLWAALTASATTRYVDLNNPAPDSPYTSWATAATNIQDAIDVAAGGDDILVTNGVYQTGAREVYGMSNRVAVTKPVTVQSVNGRAVTSIVGSGSMMPNAAVRCVYLTNAALLAGFTLADGATRPDEDDFTGSGGGVWCESVSAVVSNCVLMDNTAYEDGGGARSGTLNNCTLTRNRASGTRSSAGGGAYFSTLNTCTLTDNGTTGHGGGASFGTLNNCTLTGNSAGMYGGGAESSTLNNCTLTGNSGYWTAGGAAGGTLNNCTLTGNSAYEGGGVDGATLNNCIVYYNTAPHSENYYEGVFTYCCTTPLPAGPGNFTSEPLFVDTNGWSNLRLQTNSPCINAGTNAYVVGATDLDGRPRLVGGTVDIGAYEFQPGVSGLFLGWLQAHRLPTDGSADYVDTDHDGHNNWQEWVAGTNPTNAVSVLRMLSVTGAVSGVAVSWSSVTNRIYALERATNLGAGAAFGLLQSNLAGWQGTTSWTDSNVVGAVPGFYRVRVEN